MYLLYNKYGDDMKEYKSEYSERICNFLSDYVYLKSKDENLDGIILLPCKDDLYNFYLLHFYSKNNERVVQTITIGDTMIKNSIYDSANSESYNDYLSGHILYDPKNILKKCKKVRIKKYKNHCEPFNYVNLDNDFVSNISNLNKFNDMNDETILEDFFYNTIYDNGKIDVYLYEWCRGLIFGDYTKIKDVDTQYNCLKSATEKAVESAKEKVLKK